MGLKQKCRPTVFAIEVRGTTNLEESYPHEHQGMISAGSFSGYPSVRDGKWKRYSEEISTVEF